MKIFKFGGASVKDAQGVRNVASIVEKYAEELVVVVSAMGKTTNALEVLVRNYFEGNEAGMQQDLESLRSYHCSIIGDLFGQDASPIVNDLDNTLDLLKKRLANPPSLEYDFEYDQIVSVGEVLSTKIVSHYLNKCAVQNRWIDIRKCLRTDSQWRESNVDWSLSAKLIPSVFNFKADRIYLTQGFIGSTSTDQTTTLGREGSDFTAAILANLLNAQDVTIWKDVPGIMNADPNRFAQTQKLDVISYREAVEMTYYGAKVIHPKTMKPLVEKNIPLFVKSFLEPEAVGTTIRSIDHVMDYVPVYISKEDQILITISPLDFSFMAQEGVMEIYRIFSTRRMKINLVQQSAMNFSVAINRPERGFEDLIEDLKRKFVVHYNEGLELLTIRYYNEEVINELTQSRQLFLSQRTRRIIRFLLK